MSTKIKKQKRSFRAYLHAPRGSKWRYGNFTLGFMVDNHPMFINFIIGFGFFDIVLCWEFEE